MTQHRSAAKEAGRPTYSRQQLEQYFDLVSLPSEKRRYSLSQPVSSSTNEDFEYLRLLIKHQIVRVPFENLTQHYSWHKVIDPRPGHVFRKIVGNISTTTTTSPQPAQNGNGDNDDGSQVPIGAGRGGYCMEANTLFHTVLLSIGFDVYIAGARVYVPPEERYLGFTHCVNIVTIGGTRYLVDVAFSANVAVAPLPLPEFGELGQDPDGVGGVGPAWDHIAPAKMRLVRAPMRQGLSSARGHNLGWVYQIMYDYENEKEDEEKWITQYMFVDTEFFLEDVVVGNMYPAMNKASFFTHTVLCVRFTTDLEVGPGSDGAEGKREFPGRARTRAVQEGNIDGNMIIFGDTFKWRRGGKTVLESKLEGERDRLDILKKYFGLQLDDEDVEGIVGTAGALGGL